MTAVPTETQPSAPPSAALVRADAVIEDNALGDMFSSDRAFRAAVPIAKALAGTTLVPDTYRGNIGNCMIAMELAGRIGASVLMVMQSLYIVKGKPSFSATFLIATINKCGRFSPLRFEWCGQQGEDGWGCRAYAIEKETGERLDGEWITWRMAKGEGWVQKKDSKWQTMPGQMFRYRSASFWARAYAPEISLGMHTVEEIEDANIIQTGEPSQGTKDLNAALGVKKPEVKVTPVAPAQPAPPKVDVATDDGPDYEVVEEPPVAEAKPCSVCGGVGDKHDPGCMFFADD